MCFNYDIRFHNIQIDTHNWKAKTRIDVLVITHSHGDHTKGLKSLMRKHSPIIYTSKITMDLLKINNLIMSEYELKAIDMSKYNGEKIEFEDYHFSFFDAYHIPGSIMVMVESTKTSASVIYTGDCNSCIFNDNRFIGCMENGHITALYYDDTFLNDDQLGCSNIEYICQQVCSMHHQNKQSNLITAMDITVLGCEYIISNLIARGINILMSNDIPPLRKTEISYILSTYNQKVETTSLPSIDSILLTKKNSYIANVNYVNLIRFGCNPKYKSRGRIPWCTHLSTTDIKKLKNLCDENNTSMVGCGFHISKSDRVGQSKNVSNIFQKHLKYV